MRKLIFPILYLTIGLFLLIGGLVMSYNISVYFFEDRNPKYITLGAVHLGTIVLMLVSLYLDYFGEKINKK